MQRLGMDDRLLSESCNTKIIPDHTCLCAFSGLAGIFNYVRTEGLLKYFTIQITQIEWRAYL